MPKKYVSKAQQEKDAKTRKRAQVLTCSPEISPLEM
jgi:hypothetical protein